VQWWPNGDRAVGRIGITVRSDQPLAVSSGRHAIKETESPPEVAGLRATAMVGCASAFDREWIGTGYLLGFLTISPEQGVNLSV